jgi:hypothetical protein
MAETTALVGGIVNSLVSLRLPTPPSAKQASTTDRSEYEQQDDGSDSRICDLADHAGAEVDAELRQQPAADERPDYSDNEIAEQSKPGTSHDLPGQPSCDDADHQYDEKTFTRHVHLGMLLAGTLCLPGR